MVAQRFTLLLALAAALSLSAEAFAPVASSGKSASSKLFYQGSGDSWDYDYGGSLQYGTGQYRQRYNNDRYTSTGVNTSRNGYSQQANNVFNSQMSRPDRRGMYEREDRRMGMMGGDRRMMEPLGRGGDRGMDRGMERGMREGRGGEYFEDDYDMDFDERRGGFDERRGFDDRRMGGGMRSFHERRARNGGMGRGMEDMDRRGGYGDFEEY